MTLLQARTTKLNDGRETTRHQQLDNPSVETAPHNPQLPHPCGPGCVSDAADEIPGWVITNSGSNGETEQFRPGALANDAFFNALPGEGPTIAYGVGGIISRRVSPRVVAGNVYTLTLEIGHEKVPHDAPLGTAVLGWAIQLWPLPTVLRRLSAAGLNSLYPSKARLRRPVERITIQLRAPRSRLEEGNFDSVQLTATPIPEPGTLLLFGCGLLLFGIIIVRRKQLYGETA